MMKLNCINAVRLICELLKIFEIKNEKNGDCDSFGGSFCNVDFDD